MTMLDDVEIISFWLVAYVGW